MKHKACQKEHLRFLVRRESTPISHATYIEILKQNFDESIDGICFHEKHKPWDIKAYNYKGPNYYKPATKKDLLGIKQLVYKSKLESL